MDAKKHTLKLVTAIDMDELTIRLLEASCEMKRPLGQSSAEIMADLRKSTAHDPAQVFLINSCKAMAETAVAFMVESINAGQVPS